MREQVETSAAGERFRTTPSMRVAYWLLLLPPAYAAVVLSLPARTFDSASSYRMMRHIMAEPWWALASALVVACGALGWWRRTPLAVHGALAVVGSWHGAMALLMLVANPLSVVPGGLLALAVLTCLLALRI